MNPQLMLLLEIQDLHLQRTALLDEPGLTRMETNDFHIDPEVAAGALEERIGDLMAQLAPAVRQRCERGLPALGRMLVPVIGGVCYGCFVSIPTGRSGEVNQKLRTCENCGRFIYVLP
jgi:hypothetical protein